MPYGDSALVAETTSAWPQTPPRRGFGFIPLALATLLSFAAGVGSTLLYLQTVRDEVVVALPLIEADKAPTRVRPDGFDVAAPRLAAPGLPSPISSAMAAVVDPLVELTPQGIPQFLDLMPPAAAAVIELTPPDTAELADTAPASTVAVVPPALSVKTPPPSASEPQFQLQLASMRTPEGAQEEISRLKRLHTNLLGAFELTAQRIDQGGRGIFYRVLSSPVGDRPEAADLCTAIAQKRGQCAVVALRPAGPVVDTRVAEAAPKAPAVAMVSASPAGAAPVLAAPAPPVQVAAAKEPPASGNASEIRAQLGSLRSMEGATREVARLSRLYGPALGPTELTVSRIDQGERGVFYRILTAPLPSRDAGSDLCQRLVASQAGCVLIPGRPTA